MQFSCDKDVLLKEIAVAHEIITSRNTISILANALIEAKDDALLIKATDLKVNFETRIPAAIEVPGSTTVYCAKLLNILRSLPGGEIKFHKDGEDPLLINCGTNIQFHLNCIAAEKFPELPVADASQYFSFPQKDFIEMIAHTVFAIGNDETRYFMNGVCLDRKENILVLVATDGRRLSYASKPLEGEIPVFNPIIIPPKALLLIRKLSSGEGNLEIAVSDKIVFINFDNQKISSSLIEGQFPNYARVVPEALDKEIQVNRAELLDAIRRVALLLEPNSKRMFMTVTNDNIHLRSEETDVGSADEDVACQFTGDKIMFKMNYHYLTDPLKVIESDKVIMRFLNDEKAVIMKSIPEEDYYHVLMPMNKT